MEKERKEILEELVKVDIRLLQEKGLNPSSSFRFKNPHTGDFSENVEATATPCFFGGARYWFLCPLCRKRVAVLYLKNSFGCRDCHNLMYASQGVNRRSPYFPILRTLELRNKIEKLEAGITRTLYAGEPTKKQLQLASLQEAYLRIGVLLL